MSICHSLRVLAFLSLPLGLPGQRTEGHAGLFDPESPRGFSHDATSATWFWPGATGEASGPVILPGSVPGAAAFAGSDRILATSLDGTTGSAWISELSFVVGGSIACSVQSLPVQGWDLVRLACDPAAGRVYGIDASTKSLVTAAYSPGFQLGAWEVIASPATDVVLLRIPLPFLRLVSRLNDSVTVVSDDEYRSPPSVYRRVGGTWIAQSSGSWQVPPQVWEVAPTPNVGVGGYDLWIKGAAGTFRIIEHVSGTTVFTGSCLGNPAGEWVSVPFAQMHYGVTYRLASGSGQPLLDSAFLRVEQYWPRSSFPVGVVASRVAIRWDFPAVGSDYIGWDVHWTDYAPPPSGTVLMTMGIGPWENGVSPTANIGGMQLLSTMYGTLTTQFGQWTDSRRIGFGYVFAVNNPVFIGTKIAAQAVGVLPSGGVVVSDVTGVILR